MVVHTMITYIKGDLFSQHHPIIAHGCNAHGVMGSGVAKIVKEKWPMAFTKYNTICAEAFMEGREGSLLGTNIVYVESDVTIVNCITQHSYGRIKSRYVSYDAVDTCMQSLASGMMMHGVSSVYPSKEYIAMPMIGAGLGGGNWKVIEAIINHRLRDIDVRVYHLEDI